MSCYSGFLENGAPYIICGKLGPHCAECQGLAENLCDYPVGKEKTCDRHICRQHSNEISPNLHYCTAHFIMWKDFKLSGGVKKELENVVPYKEKNHD